VLGLTEFEAGTWSDKLLLEKKLGASFKGTDTGLIVSIGVVSSGADLFVTLGTIDTFEVTLANTSVELGLIITGGKTLGADLGISLALNSVK
jgi:hypothetical protein